MGWLSWVRPYLAVGPKPKGWPAWATLEQEDFTLVIDLNDDRVEKHQADGMGLRYRGLKVPDPTEPEDFLNAFPIVHGWIEGERESGGRVYLHCTAGQSRSPTCAIAHIMATGQTLEEAVKLVQEAHEPTWSSGDVETLEKALHLWEKQLATPRI